MTIFIIGFMGTGKSYWGKRWAAAAQRRFYDLDAVIEEAEGRTVAGIFEKKGEAYFREQEAAALRRLGADQEAIISCGGGTPCFHDNMQWMNDHGFTVCLAAGAGTILQRVLSEKEKRPLVKNLNEAELLFFIEQKLRERAAFYSQAALTLRETEVNDDCYKKFVKA